MRVLHSISIFSDNKSSITIYALVNLSYPTSILVRANGNKVFLSLSLGVSLDLQISK